MDRECLTRALPGSGVLTMPNSRIAIMRQMMTERSWDEGNTAAWSLRR